MLRLLLRAAVFFLLNGVIAFGIVQVHAKNLDYQMWDTDSVLLTMPHDAHHGAVFLGSSHAYLLSRFEEHQQIVEATLGASVCNLALPSGGGLRPAALMLEEYYARGNACDEVVYFLDPFVFYGTGANDAHKFVYDEPLDLSFLVAMIWDGYPFRRIVTYVRSKFSAAWLRQRAETMIGHPGALTAADIDPARIAMRIDTLYVDGTQEENFTRYAVYLERILALSDAHGSAVTLVVPPTLLGEEPGAARMKAYLDELARHHTFTFRDWHDAMPNPADYYNLDHLNTVGVATFARAHLAPLLAE